MGAFANSAALFYPIILYDTDDTADQKTENLYWYNTGTFNSVEVHQETNVNDLTTIGDTGVSQAPPAQEPSSSKAPAQADLVLSR